MYYETDPLKRPINIPKITKPIGAIHIHKKHTRPELGILIPKTN